MGWWASGSVCHKADMWVSTDCGNLNAGYSYLGGRGIHPTLISTSSLEGLLTCEQYWFLQIHSPPSASVFLTTTLAMLLDSNSHLQISGRWPKNMQNNIITNNINTCFYLRGIRQNRARKMIANKFESGSMVHGVSKISPDNTRI